MAGYHILVADDEPEIRNSLSEILVDEGYTVVLAESGAAALQKLASGTMDLVLLDIRLGSDDGMQLLRQLREERPTLPVIMITGHGSVALASEAFKLGAQDFLEKPLRLLQVRTAVRNALEKSTLRRSLARHAVGERYEPVVESPKMKELYAATAKLASLKAPVMILGPSGSGKELLARSLHFSGTRAAGPFVVTNAASLPVTLAEDELFGHERGAFTGAHAARPGRMEEADGGTLFLDEIADMDVTVQAKILRVLESGESCRLGGGKSVRLDVRFLCATHKDLPALIREGKFREDLYYRLSGFVLSIPPLSERKDDVVALAKRFLRDFTEESGMEKTLTAEAEAALLMIAFPGNVRELRHVLHRAAVFSGSNEIGAEDVQKASVGGASSQAVVEETPSSMVTLENFSEARLRFEMHFLQKALTACNHNISLTAQKIGMAQSNLSRKLKDLGIR